MPHKDVKKFVLNLRIVSCGYYTRKNISLHFLHRCQLSHWVLFDDCGSEYASLAEAAIFEYAFIFGMRLAIETLI